MACKKAHKFYKAKEDKAPKFRRGRNEDEYPKRHGKKSDKVNPGEYMEAYDDE